MTLISSKLTPNFDGSLIDSVYVGGGFRIVNTVAQMLAIPFNYRVLNSKESTLVYVRSTSLLYQLVSNPSLSSTTLSDWETVQLAGASAFKPVGTWNPNTNTPTLTDADAAGRNGEFYFVSDTPSQDDFTIPNLFQGQTTTLVDGNIIVSVGGYWVAVSQTTTWDAMVKPQVIIDYVNGIVQPHTHDVADITGLNALLSGYLTTNDIADHTIAFNLVPDTKITSVAFLKAWYYNKDDVADLLNNLGSGGVNEFKDLIDTPNSYTGFANKYLRVNALETGIEFVDVTQNTFTNGLTETAGVVKLGGTTSEDYTIGSKTLAGIWYEKAVSVFDDETTHIFSGDINNIFGSAKLNSISVGQNTFYLGAQNSTNTITGGITISGATGSNGGITLAGKGVGGTVNFSNYADGTRPYSIFQGSGTYQGVKYFADYSANYTSRSLIDKGYADATYATGSSSAFWKTAGTSTITADALISSTDYVIELSSSFSSGTRLRTFRQNNQNTYIYNTQGTNINQIVLEDDFTTLYSTNGSTYSSLSLQPGKVYVQGSTGFGFHVGASATPTARLQVTGAGTGSGELFRLDDSAGTNRMLILDNGNWTQPVLTSGTPKFVSILGAAHTTLANAEAIDINFNLARTVQFGQNTTLTEQRAFIIQAPTYASSVATKTITTASTFEISGAPVVGTNVSITNRYALRVKADTARFDGGTETIGALNVYGGIVVNNTVGSYFIRTTNGTNRFESVNEFVAPAVSSGTPSTTLFQPGAHTGLANAEATDINFNLARIVQFGQNTTLANQTAVKFQAPTYTSSVATKTITSVTNVDIRIPIMSTNTTAGLISALNVVGSAVGSATTAISLYVTTPSGATNNFATHVTGRGYYNFGAVGNTYGLRLDGSVTAGSDAMLSGTNTSGGQYTESAELFILPTASARTGMIIYPTGTSNGFLISSVTGSHTGYMAGIVFGTNGGALLASVDKPMLQIRKLINGLGGFDHTGTFLELYNSSNATGDFIRAWDGTNYKFQVKSNGTITVNGANGEFINTGGTQTVYSQGNISQFQLRDNSGNVKARFIYNTTLNFDSLDTALPTIFTIPVVSSTSGSFVTVSVKDTGTAFNPSSGTATFTSLLINPTYNVTGGTTTVIGLDFNPNETSITGISNYYAALFRKGKVAVGLAAPTATLHIKSYGTTTAEAFRIDDSAGTNKLLILDNGAVNFYGRGQYNQGADVASVAGTITLGEDGNSFEITGTNAITRISSTGWKNGSVIILLFTSTASLTDGTANSGSDIGFELAGNANFNATADDTITLILSEIGGTQRWREVCRSVN